MPATQTVPAQRLAVSTWSLHRTLGRLTPYGPEANGGVPPRTATPGALSLLALPAQLAAFGIHKVEICHFHLPSRAAAYLQELRTALEEAEVTLWQLLIDAGDITHPTQADAEVAWIEGWIDVAAALGATRARVSAGKATATTATLAASHTRLARLADYAEQRGVRLMTENWQNLLTKPEYVLQVLDGLDQIGLLADFGNWGGPTKYEDLAQILPRAESTHAKAYFAGPGQMDQADYVRCLELCQAIDFAGPHSLIYDGPDDQEWLGLQLERDVVAAYL
ncbi:MAG: TIM barrel protein [Caldilineaceae bacterium]|nr:TIM barrel protein [Caldilineaceae bacterium]